VTIAVDYSLCSLFLFELLVKKKKTEGDGNKDHTDAVDDNGSQEKYSPSFKNLNSTFKIILQEGCTPISIRRFLNHACRIINKCAGKLFLV
jgi:hypothetical protein